MMTETQIQELVEQTKQGDKDAFASLYEQYADAIYRYVYFRVNPDDAEDLVETVFVKAWEKISGYKQTKDNFSSWLFRIAHNLVVDHYRSTKTIETITEEYQEYRAEYHPKIVTERGLESTMLQKALKGLKDDYQQVLVLKYINELSNKEIAKLLDKSEGALRILQFRALKALRGVLEEMGLKMESGTGITGSTPPGQIW